jgi:hypothetical protein
MKIALLFGINLLIQMKEPWFTIDLRFSARESRGKVSYYFLVVYSLFIKALAKSEKK